MSFMTDRFQEGMGGPVRSEPIGLRFDKPWQQESWDRVLATIGSGWFLAGFYQLFSEPLIELSCCIDSWAFLLPPSEDVGRQVIGRNAMGALLLAHTPLPAEPGRWRVSLLDPFEVRHARQDAWDLSYVIAQGLPARALPGFTDPSLYLEYLDAGNPMLEGDQALLPKVPAGLGGAWSLDNFQVESMSEYYEETGAIYAKTFPSGAE